MTSTFLSLLFYVPSILAYNRASCQHPNNTTPPITCPINTITVGPSQNFKTIQSAILSLPRDQTPATILISPGTYTERLNISRPGPLTLLGVTTNPNTHTANTVKVLWHAATGTKETGDRDNAFTATLTVAPNIDAALTGAGPTGHKVPPGMAFGNENFRAYNVDFGNEFREMSVGPSLAVSVGYANVGFYFCGIRSWQDTVYVGKKANVYFFKGEIAGMTDFLYGFGTAWIQSAKVALRGCGGGITAWKGTNTSAVNRFGVYVHDSEVGREERGLNLTGKCSLGRPWNELHRSIYANCHMDDSIMGAGYTKWSAKDNRITSKTLMGEYHNSGPGFNEAGRNGGKISRILSEQDYAAYSTVERVFQSPNGTFGNVEWIDRNPETKV